MLHTQPPSTELLLGFQFKRIIPVNYYDFSECTKSSEFINISVVFSTEFNNIGYSVHVGVYSIESMCIPVGLWGPIVGHNLQHR